MGLWLRADVVGKLLHENHLLNAREISSEYAIEVNSTRQAASVKLD